MPLLSVVIPTYREAGSIGPLLDGLREALEGVDHEVVVVDDDSRDGTAEEAAARGARVIVRTERGLATAVVRGLQEARGTYVAVMDADGQHPPPVVRRMLEKAQETDADLVVGSRYAEGGSEGGFGPLRRLVSRGASAAAQVALPPVRGHGISDPMTGLFLVRRDRVDLAALRPQGYKILLEILGRCPIRRVEEVGYTFGERTAGESKLGGAVVLQYLMHLAVLAWGHPENRRLAKFGLVGLTGVVVNLGIFWLLVEGGLHDVLAVAIAVETSILTNFLLNDHFTFRDRRTTRRLDRLLKYNLVSLIAMVVNLSTYVVLTRGAGMHYLVAEGLAILVAFSFNYLGNLNWTYGGRDRVRLRKKAFQHLPWVLFVAIVLITALSLFVRLDQPHQIVFDEHHYVSVARQMDNGILMDPCWDQAAGGPRPLNWEHPPLAKFLMALSTRVYDTDHAVFEGCRDPDSEGYQEFVDAAEENGNPAAWRYPSALLGTLGVAFTGLAAARLFRSPVAAPLAAGLVLLDPLWITMGRIALLDMVSVGFLAGSVYFATKPTRGGALLTGLWLGMAFASKYTIVFAGPGVLLLALWTHRRAGNLSRRRFDVLLGSILGLPLAVWLLCNVPFLWVWTQDQGLVWALRHLVDVTKAAVVWGTATPGVTHEYASGPLSWLGMGRPVWFWVGGTEETRRFIYALGNPLMWWGGFLAAAVGVVATVGRTVWSTASAGGPWRAFEALPVRTQALFAAGVLALTTFAGFFVLERVTFLYYMVLMTPLLALALAGGLTLLWHSGSALGRTAVALAVAFVVGAFLHYLPFAIGMEVTMDQFRHVLVDTFPWSDACPNEPTSYFKQACEEGP